MRQLNQFLLITFFVVLAISSTSHAQTVNSSLQLDTNVIEVGQQIIAKLRLTIPAEYSAPWISIPDTIHGLEMITKGKIDTLVTADKSKLTREQKFTITAFDSGYFVLTPFVFSYRKPGDTTNYFVETQAQLLTVNLIPVDTTKAIRDIKAPIEIGLTWQEIALYCALGILIIGLTILIIYLVRRKKGMPLPRMPEKPKRPAHEIAIEELEKIKEEKIWQQGNSKHYYTRISDVLRVYISNRWNFDALEKTTDEIMQSSVARFLNAENFNRLKNTLTISDLAKFAKYTPIGSENDRALTDSFMFVNETKEVAVENHSSEKNNTLQP
jgi:hypothetical protein